MRLANLTIGARLWSAFGIVILLLVAIVIVALMRMNTAQQHVDNILNDRYRKIALTTEVKYNVARIHQHMRGAVLAPDAQAVQRETDAMNALRSTNRGLLDAFDKIINVPQAREMFNAVIAARGRDLEGQKDMLARLAAGDRAGAASPRTSVSMCSC